MPLIDNLLSLYNVDRQVRSLRSRVESAEIYLKVQKKQMDGIGVEQVENDQRQMQRKANIANTETETGSIDARIDHLRDELKLAVNDKQYSALLAEVNTLKERRRAFDDELLTEMTALEELETVASEINQRLAEREKLLKVATKELQTRESEIAEQLVELEKEREIAAAVIPDDVLSDFDEIADDYDGESMAAIEIIDKKRREYSCTSCSLHLPLETVSVLMGNKETVVKCGQCDRILYLEEASREALSPTEK
jgi:predicted  nucleic acid-binding Zn-ribbon protein